MDEYEKGMMLDMAEWSENVSREQKVKNREFVTLDQYLQLKEECCKLKEKLRLDLSHRDNELRQKVDYIHELLEIKETYKKLLKECKEELEYHSELIFCELEGCDNAKIKFKSLLTHINAAIGESEGPDETC